MPNTRYDAVVVRRVWVFGSTAKGSRTPNDLDLLIDMQAVGRTHKWTRGRKLDKGFARAWGLRYMPESEREFLKWLTQGMQKVSRHVVGVEEIPIDVKALIYPRWELAEPAEPTLDDLKAEIARLKRARRRLLAQRNEDWDTA